MHLDLLLLEVTFPVPVFHAKFEIITSPSSPWTHLPASENSDWLDQLYTTIHLIHMPVFGGVSKSQI